MTEERLAELERLAGAATPGPWRTSMTGYSVKSGGEDGPDDGIVVASVHGGAAAPPKVFDRWLDDSEFIAAAREAVPALVARVRELEARIRGLENVRDHALPERDAAIARAERAEAAAGQMRAALEKAHRWISMQDGSQHVHYTLACEETLNATDAGKGWVSPEAHAAVVAERDEARNCGQDGVCRKPPGCQRHWQERNAELVHERDEVTARAAAMREALLRVGEYITRPDAPYRIIIDKALALDAGRPLLAELAALRKVAEWSRSPECVRFHALHVGIVDPAKVTHCEICQALSALDALKAGGK